MVQRTQGLGRGIAPSRGLLIIGLMLLPLLLAAQGRSVPVDVDRLLGIKAAQELPVAPRAGISQAWEGPLNPEDYRVGPGDKISVLFYNQARTMLELSIGSDGWMTLEDLGRRDCRNLSLAELERVLSPELTEVFHADSLSLWLSQPRKIKVYAGGALQKAAQFVLEYPARVSDVFGRVKLAEKTHDGPGVSRRNVLLLHGQDSTRVDLLRFLNSGNLENNPLLGGGDRVIFPFAGPKIFVDGPFAQPVEEIEFRQGDTPETLLEALGGLQPGTEGGQFELVRQDALGKPVQNWTFGFGDTAMHQLLIAPGDLLSYRFIQQDLYFSRVQVEGEVLHPGSFAIDSGLSTLADILAQAVPHKDRADLSAIRIYREHLHDPELAYVRSAEAVAGGLGPIEQSYLKTRVTGSGGRISIFYDSSLQDMTALKLEDGDQILVTRRNEDVELVGAISNQGRIVHHPNWSIRDYLDHVGGRIRGAQMQRIRVRTRASDQFVSVKASYQPAPGDVVFVPYEEPMTAYEIFKESLTIATQLLTVVLVVKGL